MSIDPKLLQRILEGALMASAKPLSVQQLSELFDEEARPANDVIRAALEDIQNECRDRGFELKEVSSGYRFQVVQDIANWVGRLWEEKPQKYSRALLETLALIAYRQPITRGDIEDIRGVAVSSQIIKTLQEREWVRVVGHKDVPGRPAMYATTRRFLDYFNIKSLEDLPTLAEIKDLDSLNGELALEGADTPNLVDTDQDDTVQADAAETEMTVENADAMDLDDEVDAGANTEVNTAEVNTGEVKVSDEFGTFVEELLVEEDSTEGGNTDIELDADTATGNHLPV